MKQAEEGIRKSHTVRSDVSSTHSIVYSDLNKSGPWIYRKWKMMFHMTFPYCEVCDSEQYSILPIPQKNHIRKTTEGHRRNTEKIV